MTASDPRVGEIQARLDAATPGPWGWFGNTDSKSIQLATKYRGRQFIMTFRRWGMQGAQPWFNTNMMMGPASDLPRYEVCPDAQSRDDNRVYRADISGIKHPDAEFIAAAPADVAYLLAELRDRDEKLAKVLPAVTAIHREVSDVEEGNFNYCAHDGDHYPCETVRAIRAAVAAANGGGE